MISKAAPNGLVLFLSVYLAGSALALSAGAKQAPASEPGLRLYVSAKGNDANDGRTPDTAFQTLSHARDEIRKMRKAEGLKGGVTVVMQPGEYNLSESFELGEQDSGSAGAPVTYKAQEQNTVFVTSSKSFFVRDLARVSAAEPGELGRFDEVARPHVRVLNLKEQKIGQAGPYPVKFDDHGGLFEVFDQSGRMPLSRWPNKGYVNMGPVLTIGDVRTPGVFQFSSDRPGRWLKNPNVWLKGQWRVGWEDPAIKVASIVTADAGPSDTPLFTITFAAGIHLGIGSKYHRPTDGKPIGSGKEPFAAINLPEEIDEPGEWAVDFEKQVLYVWPREEGAEAKITISQQLGGDAAGGSLFSLNKTAHVKLENIHFRHALADAVVMEDVSDVKVAGVGVSQISGRGVVLHGVRSVVQACDISHIGQGAIYVSGGDRKSLTRSENVIINNHLSFYGQLKRQYSAGVHVGAMGNPSGQNMVRDAVGIRIAHNALHHAPRDAFLYSGNDNTYEYNEVYYCGYDTRDTGAFYSWLDWTMRNNVIRYNHIHSTIGGVNPDDGASGNVVYGNLFRGPNVGVWIASGPDNQIRNNVFIKPSGSVFGMDDRGVSRGYATNKRLISRLEELNPGQEPWLSAAPELANMLQNRPELPWRTKFENNLIINPQPKPPELKMAKALQSDPQIISISNNVTLAAEPSDSPIFIDEAGGNFGMRPDAAVLKQLPGFEPIPFEKMGLQVDEYRKVQPGEEKMKRGRKYSPYAQDQDENYGT